MNRSPAAGRQHWIGWLLLSGALIPFFVALFMFLLPAQTAIGWATQLGHGEDVTTERIARLRILGIILSGTHLTLAVFLASTARSAAVQFLNSLCTELSTARPASGVRQAIARLAAPGWLHLIMLAVTFAVAFSIRFKYLRVPMDYDESHSFLNYASRPLYQGLADYGSTNNHLLNTLCMHLGFKAFGLWEWSLRLHVFLAGLGAVTTIYILARYLAGADAGLIAAATAATSHVLVNYSVNARGYIWTAWMTVLLMLAFWRIAQSTAPLAVDWIGGWLAAVLGLFALPTMLYPIAGGVAWLGIRFARQRQTGRRALKSLLVWLVLVGLAVLWLYAPAFVYQGFSAWQHPFVQPQQWSAWADHMPLAWALALRSWAEGPVPWLAGAGFTGLGLATFWTLNRDGFWLIVSVFAATFAIMTLQRVAPPPRVMSFLAPLFCVLAAAGVVGIIKLAALPKKATGTMRSNRMASMLCSWIACSVCAWGYFGVRHEALPGGLRPAFLIENVADGWPRGFLASPSGPTQLWRLDVKEAVEKVGYEIKPGDRVLVGLPADLPFHFYAEQSQWPATIGGRPQSGERVFLVIRRGERPEIALQENLTLRTEPFEDYPQEWRLVALGELAIWLAVPDAPAPTEPTDP